MEKEVYVVTGATGNVGKVLAEKLLAAGRRVRVIGRSEERLRPLTEQGAEAFIGSLDDADFLTRAFDGARAVFTMIPPNYTAEDFRFDSPQQIDVFDPPGRSITKRVRAGEACGRDAPKRSGP